MRLCALFIAFCLLLGGPAAAGTKSAPAKPAESDSQPVEITADQSFEWHQNKNLYIAKGNAKAVQGDLTVTADLLTAHKREKSKGAKASKKASGDIDKLTAEGNVVILKGASRITGNKAVSDLDAHSTILTGDNLKYENAGQVVTAKETLEYWEDKKIAVARGSATATKGGRKIMGDVLTAEFRDQPNGKDQLYKLTATGNVTVVTKNDVVRGNKGVYDAARDIAVVSGNVRLSREDGVTLSGDVGEADFKTNRSRLMNSGSGRVRALLPAKSGGTKP